MIESDWITVFDQDEWKMREACFPSHFAPTELHTPIGPSMVRICGRCAGLIVDAGYDDTLTLHARWHLMLESGYRNVSDGDS